MQEHNLKLHASQSQGTSSHRESRLSPGTLKPTFAAAFCIAAMSIAFPGNCAPMSTDAQAQPASAITTASAAALPTVAADKQSDDKVVVRLKSLPYKRVLRMSELVPAGQMKVARPGTPGILAKSYRVTYKNDSIARSVYIGQHLVKSPVDEVTLAGIRLRAARSLPSRSGDYNRLRELSMVATGYSPREGSGSGRCATGMRAGYGVVAVDPRVIRLGSKLYISGYGYAVAGDTGGAIKHNRIDLGHNTYGEALGIGRRHVTVYVLDKPR